MCCPVLALLVDFGRRFRTSTVMLFLHLVDFQSFSKCRKNIFTFFLKILCKFFAQYFFCLYFCNIKLIDSGQRRYRR